MFCSPHRRALVDFRNISHLNCLRRGTLAPDNQRCQRPLCDRYCFAFDGCCRCCTAAYKIVLNDLRLRFPSKSMVLWEPPSVKPFAAFHPHVYPCRVTPAGFAFFVLISSALNLQRRLRALFLSTVANVALFGHGGAVTASLLWMAPALQEIN